MTSQCSIRWPAWLERIWYPQRLIHDPIIRLNMAVEEERVGPTMAATCDAVEGACHEQRAAGWGGHIRRPQTRRRGVDLVVGLRHIAAGRGALEDGCVGDVASERDSDVMAKGRGGRAPWFTPPGTAVADKGQPVVVRDIHPRRHTHLQQVCSAVYCVHLTPHREHASQYDARQHRDDAKDNKQFDEGVPDRRLSSIPRHYHGDCPLTSRHDGYLRPSCARGIGHTSH